MNLGDHSELNISILPGDVFKAMITHVVDEKTFYVMKAESAVLLGEIQEYLMKMEMTNMFWYPIIGEKFLYHPPDSDEYFRAKRIPDGLPGSNNISVFLMDVGETHSVPLASNKAAINLFYSIPEDVHHIPSLVRKCKIDLSEVDKTKDFLTDNLCKNLLTFEAVKVVNDIAHVKIYPFDQQLENGDEDYEDSKTIEDKSVLDQPVFSKDELDELYEEPLDTEDALVAVQGFSAKVDEQLCPFYDPKTGGCFKKSLCKLKHLPPTDEYNYRDKQSVFMGSERFDKFVPGQTYDIKITQFIAVNKIIFQFADFSWWDKFEKIQDVINDEKHTKDFKKFTVLPAINQLAVARIKEQNYRVKIVNVQGENYVVWCVDMGSLKAVKLENLYEWTINLNDFPYLTFEVEISNIIPISLRSKKAMLFIMDHHEKSQYLRANIVMEYPLRARLLNHENVDIGELLIEEGYAKKNPYELSPLDDNIPI